MSNGEAQQQQEQEKQGRQTSSRPNNKRVMITERDIGVLRWIGEQYAARVDQIQRLLGAQSQSAQEVGILSESATRVWRRRMQKLELIEENAVFYRQLPTVWLTAAGLKLAGLDFRPLTPAIITLRHLYWTGQARLYAAKKRPDWQWIPERRIRQEQARTARENQEFVKVKRRSDAPDGVLVTQDGKIAIEIELADKERARLEKILANRSRTYPSVWYFCSQEARPGVEKARARLSEASQKKILIYDLSAINLEE